MDYAEFLARKAIRFAGSAIQNGRPIGTHLFDFQVKVTEEALDRGRAAIFADCGLGKTVCQLEWASHIDDRVLLVAPLAIAKQTLAEAERFGYDAALSRTGSPSRAQITVTNYEQTPKFEPGDYRGVILDESSILKSHDGAFARDFLTRFGVVPYRLCCSATPAPNDFMELGTHAEFLGAMTKAEMLALFFVHDGGKTSQWRLKRHGRAEFWRWVSSWGRMFSKPSDLGCDDDGFALPPYVVREHFLESPGVPGQLFAGEASLDLNARRRVRRESVSARAEKTAALVADKPGPWLVWCDLNDEAETVRRMIPNAVEVRGSDDAERKADVFLNFARGNVPVLVTKPKIAAYGLNWQVCSRMAFMGLSDSYESFYQAIRRCWRFGQKKRVEIHVVATEADRAVVRNIARKQHGHNTMLEQMVEVYE